MASKFVVFVVFVAVAQASLAAADVQSYKNETLSQWIKDNHILFDALANPKPNFDTVQSDYVTAGQLGALALAKAILGENQTAVGTEPFAGLKEVAEYLVAAVKTARTATSKNIHEVYRKIDRLIQKVPVEDDISGYFALANSTASQNATITHDTAIYQTYAVAFKAQAAKLAGKSKSVDLKSFQDQADTLVAKSVDDLWYLVPTQG